MRGLVVVFGLSVSWLAAVIAEPARANIFTNILREAGEAGGKAATHGAANLGAVGKAASHLKGLGAARRGALAGHATPEGHWQFVNREGQVYTAGTPEEMKRVLSTLAPDAVAAGDSRMTLYVSEDSVFQNRSALAELPKDAEIHVVTDGGAFAVLGRAGEELAVRVMPHLTMRLADRALFDEAIFYLGRPFNRANVRTVGFEPGGKPSVPSAPTLDPETKLPVADIVDPAHLRSAFGSIRGQTVVVTGRVENAKLVITSSKGNETSFDVGDVVASARARDINLIVLHTESARQPGALNWLWQRMEVGGLSDAGQAINNGDFLEALAARRGDFELAGSTDGAGRVHFSVRQRAAGGLVDGATDFLGEAVGHVTGEIVAHAADVYAMDENAQSEREARLIPGVPTYMQYPYLVSLVAGVLAWSTARGWWQRVWPAQASPAAGGRLLHGLRQMPRELIYWLGFLPVAGLPALLIQTLVQFWLTVTAPFRWVYRKFLRREV